MILIFFSAAIGLRLLWSCDPGLLVCCMFWLVALTVNVLGRQWLILPGILSNAAATIANGGFMPSNYNMPHMEIGIYVDLTSDSAFPFLCDCFDGTSIGDFLLLAGIAISLVWSVLKSAGILAPVGGSVKP